MIARQDNENLYLIYSDDLYSWNGGEVVLKPLFPWEFVQIGNCGSPIELDEGWLLLTHGVGPVRRYSHRRRVARQGGSFEGFWRAPASLWFVRRRPIAKGMSPMSCIPAGPCGSTTGSCCPTPFQTRSRRLQTMKISALLGSLQSC